MKTLKSLFLILVAAVLLSSCGSQKRITYLHDLSEEREDETYTPAERDEYTVRPGDLLHIQVQTMNKEYNTIFQGSQQTRTRRYDQQSTYYTSYMVKDDGKVTLPLVDEVEVEGMTIKEVRKHLREEISAYLKEFSLIVRFASYRFTVIGEVRRPGTQVATQNDLNIFEAISMAGEATYNANRENVILIRQQEGREVIKHIDLSKKEILSSKDFHIQPGDIIYVKPLKRTVFRESAQDYMFIVSAVSTVVSTTAIILSLFQ